MKELVREHGALVRYCARLQQSVTETLQAQRSAIEQLEGQAIRLRGQLLVARTQVYWGVGGAPVRRPPAAAASPVARAPRPAPYLPQAEAVLCRTACEGHAHPWRDAHGRCQRSGEPCGSDDLG